MIRWAQEHPGRSAIGLLQRMEDIVGAGGKRKEWAPDERPVSAMSYYLRVLKHQHPTATRNHREMETLCTVLDLLAQDRPEEAADVVAQRLKAVEMATTDQNWGRANYLELLPAQPETLATKDEHHMVREKL